MQSDKPHSTNAWEAYRRILVDKTLLAFYVLAWLGIPLFVWRSLASGWRPINLLTVALVVAGMIFFHFGKNVSTDIKGSVLVAIFFGLAIPGLLSVGVLSNGLLLIATGCMCASLVFSMRISLLISAGSLIFLSLVGIGFVSGTLQLHTDANVFATSSATWLTAVFVNFLTVLILISRIASFSSSLQSLLVEVEQQRDVIAHQANHDQLTDLPTLRLAKDRLDMAIKNASRKGSKVALLFIDLDGFKQANDSFGHDAGDRVLQEVARHITASIRAGDTACRIGGDEFLVILGDLADQRSAALVAQKIIDAVNRPISFEGHQVRVGCSIGIGVYPDHASDGKGLRVAADTAMYSVKRLTKNNFAFYQQEIEHST